MKQLRLFALGLSLCLLSSCSEGQDDRDKALQSLSEAQTLLEKQDYPLAYQAVSKALETAPSDTLVIKKAISLKKTLRRAEAETELVKLAEELKKVDVAVRQSVQQLKEIKNTQYDTELRYQDSHNIALGNANQPYLKFQLDSLGNTYFTSIYIGKGGIQHNAIKLINQVDSSYQTKAVAYDQALNYRYQVAGKDSERVSYDAQDNQGIADFIYQSLQGEQKAKINLQYLRDEKAYYKLELSKQDIQSFKKYLSIHQKLQLRDSLRREEDKFTRRLSRLNNDK